jgi:hypothetical protein
LWKLSAIASDCALRVANFRNERAGLAKVNEEVWVFFWQREVIKVCKTNRYR